MYMGLPVLMKLVVKAVDVPHSCTDGCRRWFGCLGGVPHKNLVKNDLEIVSKAMNMRGWSGCSLTLLIEH